MEHTEHFEKRFEKRFKDNQPAVIAVFKDRSVLKKTLRELKESKFNNDDISVLAATREDISENSGNYHPEKGALIGLLAGMATGALTGWLAGQRKKDNPIMSAFKGSLYGGAIGGVSGAVIKYGIAKMESIKLKKFVKDKGIIISVHIDNPRDLLKAKNILVTNGAVKIANPYLDEFAQLQ